MWMEIFIEVRCFVKLALATRRKKKRGAIHAISHKNTSWHIRILTGLTLPSREWCDPPLPPSRWFVGGARKSPVVAVVAVEVVPTLELKEKKLKRAQIFEFSRGKGS